MPSNYDSYEMRRDFPVADANARLNWLLDELKNARDHSPDLEEVRVANLLLRAYMSTWWTASDEVTPVVDLTVTATSVIPAPIVKRKRGRPRKHPLPETRT